MIGLFRRIRRKLGSQNNFIQYSRYAVGEIVLVMVGILLALQVNNWNELRKEKNEEIEILNSFKRSMSNDIAGLNRSISINRKIKKSINLILNQMEQDLPYKDSLKYHFGNTNVFWTYTISSSVFEALKSKNLNLITNKNLRQKIINLYTWSNGTFSKQQERYRNIVENASEGIYSTRFDEF